MEEASRNRKQQVAKRTLAYSQKFSIANSVYFSFTSIYSCSLLPPDLRFLAALFSLFIRICFEIFRVRYQSLASLLRRTARVKSQSENFSNNYERIKDANDVIAF